MSKIPNANMGQRNAPTSHTIALVHVQRHLLVAGCSSMTLGPVVSAASSTGNYKGMTMSSNALI